MNIWNHASAAAGAALLAFSIVNGAIAATLTHLYEFNSSFEDSLGTGNALLSSGGTLGAGSYDFGANQGLSLSNGIDSDNYSILLDFSINQTTGYRKLIDFKNLSSDNGLYNRSGKLRLFPVNESAPVFSSGVLSRLVVTRDAATNAFTAYINGVSILPLIVDSSNYTVFSSANSIIQFFKDDRGGSEASAGTVDTIAIYDGALTGDEVSALGKAGDPLTPDPEPVPEPLTILGSLVAAGLGFQMKRRFASSPDAVVDR